MVTGHWILDAGYWLLDKNGSRQSTKIRSFPFKNPKSAIPNPKSRKSQLPVSFSPFRIPNSDFKEPLSSETLYETLPGLNSKQIELFS